MDFAAGALWHAAGQMRDMIETVGESLLWMAIFKAFGSASTASSTRHVQSVTGSASTAPDAPIRRWT